MLLKGTVPGDFLPLGFIFKLFLLGPVDMPRNDFDFFRLFLEIFDYFGASPVSTIPAMHALPVSLTPVNNSSPVSDNFTGLESFTGVNDTGKNYSPVSLTPAKHAFTGVNDTGEACICWSQ
jgi:hypothetical protein